MRKALEHQDAELARDTEIKSWRSKEFGTPEPLMLKVGVRSVPEFQECAFRGAFVTMHQNHRSDLKQK